MKPLLLAVLTVALPLAPVALAEERAPQAARAAPDTSQVVAHYATLVHAVYEDTLTQSLVLQEAVKAFVAQPSASTQEAARKAWLAAREVYGQTEAFRFYGGPIDDEQGPEGRLNAWPMDEAFVDSVKGKPGAGLINNRKVALSKKTLAAHNERGGEENISTGWHAIEFLLWGQDLNEAGPGARSFEDFVDGKAPNADRRRQYLGLVTQLLVDDLRSLVQAWAPGVKNNYRARFEKGGSESLRKIFVGLGSLSRGELAGERLEVALASQDQEDEHSCFSDNTHRDAVTNALGIRNVWLGEYQRLDGSRLQGPSLRHLVGAADAALAERTTRQIAASVRAAEAIQAPFDREITGAADAPGRLRVQQTIASLVQQSKDLVEAAHRVGITRLTLTQPQ
ncbi:iron-regulated protein [Aquabacterium sp. A7-Y]|uniref:imelysin family protein n=1 Tax=Aquabacterium sp. A7-Y TaxID=1349605 RepID=UPI00223D22C6|nr:imelysin family protein [Aquabacterium sp. A7-Y]MCW7539217.1 iron-regulated protein [Aquabacterium sp. A7-Y]